VKNPVDRKIFDKISGELFHAFAMSMIKEATTIKLTRLGDFRIRGFKPKYLNAAGELKAKILRPDWKKTKEYWAVKYGGLSAVELKKIKNKPIIYHMNEHSNGYSYETIWNKQTVAVKGKSCYYFKAARKYDRERARLIKEEGMTYYE